MNLTYERKINYYETDKMGIVHHSNYIRFLEEARIFYLEKLGLPYDDFEKQGILIPVLNVNCNYKYSVTFNDVILIKVFIKEYTGVRFTIGYHVIDKKTQHIVLTGETKHCFTDKSLKPIRLCKKSISYDELFKKLVKKEDSI